MARPKGIIKPCEVVGCGFTKKVAGRYCGAHYQRSRHTNVPMDAPRQRVKGKCKVDFCKTIWHCRQLCKMHYSRAMRGSKDALNPYPVTRGGLKSVKPFKVGLGAFKRVSEYADRTNRSVYSMLSHIIEAWARNQKELEACMTREYASDHVNAWFHPSEQTGTDLL